MQVENRWRLHGALGSLDVFKQGLHLLPFLVQVFLCALLEYVLYCFHFEEAFVFKMLVSDSLTALAKPFLRKALITLVDQIIWVDCEKLADECCVFLQQHWTFPVRIRSEYKL